MGSRDIGLYDVTLFRSFPNFCSIITSAIFHTEYTNVINLTTAFLGSSFMVLPVTRSNPGALLRLFLKKACQIWSTLQVLLIVFFDYNVIIHYKLLTPGHKAAMVNCLEVLHHLHEAIWSKWTELWANNSWILHHNNTPAHTSLQIREFLAILTSYGPLQLFLVLTY